MTFLIFGSHHILGMGEDRHFKFGVQIDITSSTRGTRRVQSSSLDLFNFWEITDNITLVESTNMDGSRNYISENTLSVQLSSLCGRMAALQKDG